MPALSPFRILFGAAAGLHAADQLAMAALPLSAVLLLQAGPAEIGALLAAQSAAWLVCSLPAGLLVDRAPRRRMLLRAGLLAMAGLALGWAGAGAALMVLLALGAFVASAGTVLFVLAAGAAVPEMVGRDGLARANARLELARAGATLAAPPLVASLAMLEWLGTAYALAALVAGLAGLLLRRLPGEAPRAVPPRRSLGQEIRDGAGFALRDRRLRAIGLCALFWNMGFFALLTDVVPYALGELGMEAGLLGLAQSGYGAGLLLGAALAPFAIRRFGLNGVLLLGPGMSLAAPGLLLAAPGGGSAGGVVMAMAALFLVGFGPMMWLVTQLSLRQAVTPRHLLGRVGASLQVAIYGVRPLGALAAGGLAAAFGPGAGLFLAGLLFAASLTAIALSDLARLRRLPPAEHDASPVTGGIPVGRPALR